MSKTKTCVDHAQFSAKDVERLEARVAALKKTGSFTDDNAAYAEAAASLAKDTRVRRESILASLRSEDAAKAKPLPVAPPEAEKYGSVPDLADALAKENGLPKAVADAYVQYHVLGRSHAKIAEDLGVTDSAIHEWLAGRPARAATDKIKARDAKPGFNAMMEEAKRDRLEAGVDAAKAPAEAAGPAEAAVAPTPTPEVTPEVTPEGEGVGAKFASEDVNAAGDLVDEANLEQGQTDGGEFAGLNISDNPYGEGKTSADNNISPARSEQLAKVWAKFNNAVGTDKRVAWKDLGSAQQDTFDASYTSATPESRLRKIHAELSELRASGVRYATADIFHLEGATGAINGLRNPVTPATMAGPRAAMVPIRFPALATLKGPTTAVYERATYEYGPPNPTERATLASAMENLSQSALAPFYSTASKLLLRVGVFTPTEKQLDWGAAHLPREKTVVFNKNHLGGTDPATNLVVTQFVAHEMGHLVDSAAGPLVGQREASGHPNSPTLMAVTYEKNGKVSIGYGPVLKEALKAYAFDSVKYRNFNQALLNVVDVLDKLAKRDFNLGPLSMETLDRVADIATKELTPKLLEFYAASPEMLKADLPLGYAHARALANASTLSQAASILGGTDVAAVSVPNTYARGAGPRGPVREVHGEVQRGSAPHSRDDVGAANPTDAQGPGGRQNTGRADTGRRAVGTADRLTLPPPITNTGGIVGWLKTLAGDKVWRTHPSLLGFLSTEQMADRWKGLPLVKAFSDAMRKMDGRATQVIAESDRHSTQWSALRKRHGPAVDNSFNQLLLDATGATMWPDRDIDADGNHHLDAKDAATVAEHDRLSRQFRALPMAYKSLFHAVVRDKAEQREQQIAGLRKGIVSSFYTEPGQAGPSREMVDAAAAVKRAERTAFAKANVKTALDSKMLTGLWRHLDEHRDAFKALAGPYFPKMRFGDHIVSYKTAKYQAAEVAVQQANDTVQTLLAEETYAPIAAADAAIKVLKTRLANSTVEATKTSLAQELADNVAARDKLMAPLKAARKLHTDQQNALMLLKADGENYGVEFYETRALAQANEERLRAHFGDKGTTVTRAMKDQFLRSMDGVTPAFMRNLEDKMSASLTGTDAAKVRGAMRELYLRLQPENSALKRQLKRMNVSGVRADEAQRAYALSSLRAAHSISRLEYGDELHRHLNDLRFEHKGDEDSQLIGNELALRIGQNLAAPEDSKALNLVANATYLTYLGMSPSFMVTQITQPWVISAPIMAGRHGVAATGKMLSRASTDAVRLLKSSFDADKRMKYHLDPQLGVKDGVVNGDEAKMLQELMDHGRIDITITHDLGATSTAQTENMLSGAAQMASYPAQQLEMMNRVATALAGYRAERAKGSQHLEAMTYADTLVADTHLNYAAANRARHLHPNSFGGWGRVMFQFRAYQQGMLYLLYKNIADGLRGNSEARKSVAYLAGMQLATAGLAGMPVPGVLAVVIGMLYAGFTDDDDEQDLKEALYQGVKSALGETGARAVMKGIPAAMGVDVSSKVGMGNVASIAPYADDSKEGREIVKEYFGLLAGGPALGMAANWAEAVKAASDGDWLKATGFAAPKALSDPAKALGYQLHGTLDSRGNTILAADEIGAAETVIKALGFQPTDIARVQEQRRAFFEARGNRNDARAKLIAEYAHARMNGDDVASMRQAVQEFNQRHPDNRISYSTLEKAVANQRQRARDMRNGVPVGKKDRALAAELGIE